MFARCFSNHRFCLIRLIRFHLCHTTVKHFLSRWRSFLNGLTYRIDGNAVESDQPPLIGILFFYPLSCPNKD
ncbi:hypothetical protein HanXRQr2_Chr12g0534291 [Helianthus annuus]|uniref:Uncharacterized protein n=1 Tax=Helianthus annuus TaxID=4232 RepID=A0A251UBC3_HELAN|nr:hypothetical protein HanXRQr2_Chr12g0534291 [Helianthus annuus]KAJ0488883.1 hypothetical protein HanHA300_Chr12g0437811 [Helianthus annuus]KAJ0504723.1 hypothetical protein HanHA89_Chr12g0462471 [Helianthus annuus]KAJ0674455.1 hypothetical protein HanLR1_Chr12g0440151 [Helianthus annuus]KAJ0862132.1 hypothetical protein HanPSC8_Chr12g0514581 [Helianthus annuus]